MSATTMRATLDELASLEPCVRHREVPALKRTRALLLTLERLWKASDDSDIEVEAADLRTKMEQLVCAAEANVFKGVIKGPYEFSKDQEARDLKARLVAKCGQEQRRQRKRKADANKQLKPRMKLKLHDHDQERFKATRAQAPPHDEIVETQVSPSARAQQD